jgi:hypothetical protein
MAFLCDRLLCTMAVTCFERAMLDLTLLVTGLGIFALLAVYIAACERV